MQCLDDDGCAREGRAWLAAGSERQSTAARDGKVAGTSGKQVMANQLPAIREVLPPFLLGVVAALMIVGVDGMNPRNIGWISGGDPATHFLGWWFFRNSEWRFPLGANPDYGMGIGSSIFYSDSIPLLAFLFKPLSGWLPTPFQYLGIWVAACLVLQSWFAWRLLGCSRLTRPLALRLGSTGLFVFSPPLLHRIPGHSALVGHWTILAALWLYMTARTSAPRRSWVVLAATTSLVHSYLFAMVLAIWLADVARRVLGKVPLGSLGAEAALVLGLSGLSLWQGGFFMVDDRVAGGFGHFALNLLAPIIPGAYSRLLGTVSFGSHEGFAFLGLGGLLLIPIVAPLLVTRCPPLRLGSVYWPLAVCMAGLLCFALSHRVGVGPLTFTVPVPEAFVRWAGTLRSSGRMFWPVYYVLLFVLIASIAKYHGERTARWTLAGAFLLQVLDTSEQWLKKHHMYQARSADHWSSPLESDFWKLSGSRYRSLRTVPLPARPTPDYTAFAYLAASNQMATDFAHLARVGAESFESARGESSEAISTGNFDPRTLYVLDKAHAALSARWLSSSDLLTRVDGYYVLAPGWKRLAPAAKLAVPELALRDFIPEVAREQSFFFGTSGTGVAYLGEGWSKPENWGVWSQARRATLQIPVPEDREALMLEFELSALVAPQHPSQHVECWINGVLIESLVFDVKNRGGRRTVAVPRTAPESSVLRVVFEVLNPGNPKALGIGRDTRDLGIALRQMRILGEPPRQAIETSLR